MESIAALKQWYLICKGTKLKKFMIINVKTFTCFSSHLMEKIELHERKDRKKGIHLNDTLQYH